MAKILVTDDSEINTKIVERILKNEHFEIVTALGGLEALEKINSTSFDLILLDIEMPDMSGFEVCKKIRANPDTKDIPVIFLTGKDDDESLLKGFEVGGQDYLTKPFKATELLARVRTHAALKLTYDKQEILINELKNALAQVKQLNGLLPICGHCKKIRDDQGYWTQVEFYISDHADVDFSHSICPECMKEKYPKQYKVLHEKGLVK